MSESNPVLWPPPPLHPSVEVLEVERVRVVRTQDRLTLTNFAAKRALWMGVILALMPAPLTIFIVWGGVLSSGSSSASQEKARQLVSFLFHDYHQRVLFITEAVVLLLVAWASYTFLMHKGLFTLDKHSNSFQRGGRNFYPLPEIETVAVRPSTQIDKRWSVGLVRKGGDSRPRWRQLLSYPARPDVMLLAPFCKQEHAEAVANVVADFAGVPISRLQK